MVETRYFATRNFSDTALGPGIILAGTRVEATPMVTRRLEATGLIAPEESSPPPAEFPERAVAPFQADGIKGGGVAGDESGLEPAPASAGVAVEVPAVKTPKVETVTFKPAGRAKDKA